MPKPPSPVRHDAVAGEVSLSAPDDLVPMGYVAGSFGVHGWLKVVAETEYADSLLDFDCWWLGREGAWRAYRLVEGAIASKHLHVQLEGLGTREAAHALKGSTIAVPRSLLPEPGEGEYYWADLIGMAVCNRAGEKLGDVRSLMNTGAHDVLVVSDGAHERLIPFVGPVVDGVNTVDRVILVDWGLDY